MGPATDRPPEREPGQPPGNGDRWCRSVTGPKKQPTVLGIDLPEAPPSAGEYVGACRSIALAFVSGQIAPRIADRVGAEPREAMP